MSQLPTDQQTEQESANKPTEPEVLIDNPAMREVVSYYEFGTARFLRILGCQKNV